MKCDIQIACEPSSALPKKVELRKVLAFLSQEFDLSNQSLSLRIVSPSESQVLNRTYRGKDKPTNVLSFPYTDQSDFPLPKQIQPLGDLALCHEVIVMEAQTQHKSLQDHYIHLIIHGILHLLGYDHENDTDAEEMETLEINLLKTLAINNPYEDKHHGA